MTNKKLTKLLEDRCRPYKDKRRFLLFWKAFPTPEALPMDWFQDDKEEETWESWERKTKGAYPVQFFLRKTLTLWFTVHVTMCLQHMYDWVRYRIWARFHVISLKNKAFDYSYGYVDPRQAMLFASMNIFQGFCEKEGGLETLKYQFECDADPDDIFSESAKKDAKDIYDKALEIYNWWCKGGFQAEQSAVHALYEKAYPKDGPRDQEARIAWLEAEKQFDLTEQRMMLKLIEIREWLWT